MAYVSRASSAAWVFACSILVASCATGRDGSYQAVCSPDCSGGTTCCAVGATNICASTATDRANCGSCGNVCSATQVCRSGRCETSAGVDAGRSGNPGVDAGSVTGGTCNPMCRSSERCCGSACVNRSAAVTGDGRSDSSFSNCNGCGIACDSMTASACSMPVSGGAPACRCGNFPACTGGQVCAMGATGTFQCVSTQTDANNCGSVGHRCAVGESCSGGMCRCGSRACSTGESCCGGACVNTASSDANCGGCGLACTGGSHCSASHCMCGSRACASPEGDNLGEICCGGSCVPQDSSNCGGCGNTCMDSLECILGGSFMGGDTMPCCGVPPIFPIPGVPNICLDLGGGLPGGGFPGGGDLPDAGISLPGFP